MTIISPFDSNADESSRATTASRSDIDADGPLDLTWDNVELVLDTMRDYLIQDGGNVAIKEIDGPVVRLELQVWLFNLYLFYFILLCVGMTL